MPQDEIIDLARQAGLCDAEGRDDNSIIITDHFEAFAKLVEDEAFKRWAAQTKLAVQDEREACLNIACDYTQKFADHTYTSAVADAIRNRGQS
jgi:hypothetical protein